jgi:gp16 family phage-associated protein
MPHTSKDVRADFERKGIAISDWARENGVSAVSVHHLLSGRTVGRRGQAHRVAVLLGLKDGEVCTTRNARAASGTLNRSAHAGE